MSALNPEEREAMLSAEVVRLTGEVARLEALLAMILHQHGGSVVIDKKTLEETELFGGTFTRDQTPAGGIRLGYRG